MLTEKFNFSKKERLKSKKEIYRIFNEGIFFYAEHIGVKFVETINHKQYMHKVGISVPKRLFKLAVLRNKIKRRIRESYRLNKNIVYSTENPLFLNFFFIYKSNEIKNNNDIENEIIILLKKLQEYIIKKSDL